MRFRVTYANVVSTLALILALSGGAYAANGGSLILGRGNSASSRRVLPARKAPPAPE
jgi:hypothetical protein